MSKAREGLLIFVLASLACFTQLYAFYDVPGFHFDEAWQGLFAHRIASEHGFWPTYAMNGYTSPVVHYLLAAVFYFFSPTLSVMRLTYASFNLLTLAIVMAFLWRSRKKTEALWFALFFSLLPLSVHTRRFYVELTGFHSLCFALFFAGVVQLKTSSKLQKTSLSLIFISSILGIYSHVLFLCVPLTLAALGLCFETQDLKALRKTLAIIFLCSVPLTVRMGFDLKKALPFLLSAGLFSFSLVLFFFKTRWRSNVQRIIALKPLRWTLGLICVFFLFPYVFLFWNGNWPYAQATGQLHKLWIPFNTLGFVLLFYKTLRDKKRHLPLFLLVAFALVFILNSLMVFKPSPRYYATATLVAMLWGAFSLVHFFKLKTQCVLAAIFLVWNFFSFHIFYLQPFQKYGATDGIFRQFFYKDSSRDFRPYQKAWEWVVAHHCQETLTWVEDDRFLRQVEFLKLTAPMPKGKCPWSNEDLFFSHIPNYQFQKNLVRTAENTAPPFENVKLLAHSPEWGDLAFWTRKK